MVLHVFGKKQCCLGRKGEKGGNPENKALAESETRLKNCGRSMKAKGEKMGSQH